MTIEQTVPVVTCDARDGVLRVRVQDDGCGLDPVDAGAGRGLSNMRKRIAGISIGGAIFIDSSPGRGTTVRLELKVPPSA